MIRHPAALDVVNRLDFILKQKAEEGVKICILVWSETKIAVGLNSENVQAKMSALHKNISVQRHPLNYPLKWSHHQKIVVVDQNIAVRRCLTLMTWEVVANTKS
jgi:phospholipase D1/2